MCRLSANKWLNISPTGSPWCNGNSISPSSVLQELGKLEFSFFWWSCVIAGMFSEYILHMLIVLHVIKPNLIILDLLWAANHIHNCVFIKEYILYKDFIEMLIATGIMCTQIINKTIYPLLENNFNIYQTNYCTLLYILMGSSVPG